MLRQTHFKFYHDYGVENTFHPKDYRYGKTKYGLTFAFWA